MKNPLKGKPVKEEEFLSSGSSKDSMFSSAPKSSKKLLTFEPILLNDDDELPLAPAPKQVPGNKVVNASASSVCPKCPPPCVIS